MNSVSLGLFDTDVLQKIEKYKNTYALYSKFRSLKTKLILSSKKKEEIHYINLDLLYVNDFGKSLYLSIRKELSIKISNFIDLELFDKAIELLIKSKKILVIDSFQYAKNIFIFEELYIAKFKSIIKSNQIQMILISNNIEALEPILEKNNIIVINEPTYKKSKNFLYKSFSSFNYLINDENINYVLDFTQNIPYYLQEFLDVIIQNKIKEPNSNNEINKNDITLAFNTIYEQERVNIMFMLQKANHRKLAIEILMYFAVNKNPYILLELYDIKKPYINGVIKYLIDNDILYTKQNEKKVENRYKFVNPIMKKHIASRVVKNDLISYKK